MSHKRMVVIGDRVLVKPDLNEERTKVGLYLPQTVKDKEEVRGGVVVQTGPGIPLADPADVSGEPWKQQNKDLKFLPVQAKAGDYALYIQKAGVEITYGGESYVILPQSAILIVIREDQSPRDLGLSPDEDDLTY